MAQAHLDLELLSAYIDAELSPADMEQVEAHLATCEACRAEFAELRGIATLVREMPTYVPRQAIDLGSSGPSSGSATMARIIEFSKPLAVAAIILLIAFAGLRLLTDFGDDSGGDEDQVSFSALQEPTPDGTDSAGRASETIAAGEPALDAAGAQPEESGESANTTMQEAPSDSEQMSEPAPAAARMEQEPTATAPVEPTVSSDEGSNIWLVTGIAVVVVAIAGSAAWYTFARSPRRPRP